jgi:deoxyribonuclease-4
MAENQHQNNTCISFDSSDLCIGLHASISKSFAYAASWAFSCGCGCMQIFTKNPRSWTAKPIDPDAALAFHAACSETGIMVNAHGSYLSNPASVKPVQIEKSIDAISTEISRCEDLRIPYLVVHCGHGQDDESSAQSRVISCLTEICSRAFDQQRDFPVTLLVENSAGDIHSVGSRFEELAAIIDGLVDAGFSSHIGACFDTCHAYAAGYPLNTEDEVSLVISELTSCISQKRIHLIHLNDSQGACGSGRDRHLPPGEGAIGVDGFSALMQHSVIRDKPMICEVPISDPKAGQDLMSAVQKMGNNLL